MTDDTPATRRDEGAAIVRRMFGDEFLERNMGGPSRGDGAAAAMAGLALEQCYGDIWSRTELSPRDRSLLTLGILVALGHPGELANHVLGGVGNGLTAEELTEVALHAVPYVGFPAAGQAMRVIQKTLSSLTGMSSESSAKEMRA